MRARDVAECIDQREDDETECKRDAQQPQRATACRVFYDRTRSKKYEHEGTQQLRDV